MKKLSLLFTLLFAGYTNIACAATTEINQAPQPAELVNQPSEGEAMNEKFMKLALVLSPEKDKLALSNSLFHFLYKIIFLEMITGSWGAKAFLTELNHSSSTLEFSFLLVLLFSFFDLVEIYEFCKADVKEVDTLTELETLIKNLNPQQREEIRTYLKTPKLPDIKNIPSIYAHEVVYGKRKEPSTLGQKIVGFVFDACIATLFMRRLHGNVNKIYDEEHRRSGHSLAQSDKKDSGKNGEIIALLTMLAILGMKNFLCTSDEDEKKAILDRIKNMLDETDEQESGVVAQ